MARTTIGLLALALVTSRAAGAQTTTVDGVRAYLRGDYATAARVLRSADVAQPPDPTALFFLAGLYESGQGVPQNIVRACGMYVRAASMPGPLQALSQAKARELQGDHPVMQRECAAASTERWGVPPDGSFTLAPDHQIDIENGAFVVRYHESTKRREVPLGGAGWVFLPTRYTALDTPRSQPSRRHFIEFFTWLPADETRTTWALVWFVYEIVGVEAVWMSGESIATGDRPSTSIDVNPLARIRVNGDGEPEWAVSGANPRAAVLRPKEHR